MSLKNVLKIIPQKWFKSVSLLKIQILNYFKFFLKKK